jgi:hypothetical protein
VVTSRQFARGMVRTVRAMDRAAKQAERQRHARQLASERQQHLDASARVVAQYDAVISALMGAHRIQLERRDWLTTATADLLDHPERRDDAEVEAAARLECYEPGWFTRVLGREMKVRQRLAEAVEAARADDDVAHAESVAEVRSRNEEIEEARLVVAQDPHAMVRALEEHGSLGDLPFAVEALKVVFSGDRIIAVANGLPFDEMPEQSASLLKSGKASIKDVPLGKRQELHRDAVCSAAVRVAIEFLNALPIDAVEVLMLCDLLDRGTGHIEPAAVLHLRTTAQALGTLNLVRADAVALVERLGGHLDWSKREGFRAISAAAFGIEL